MEIKLDENTLIGRLLEKKYTDLKKEMQDKIKDKVKGKVDQKKKEVLALYGIKEEIDSKSGKDVDTKDQYYNGTPKYQDGKFKEGLKGNDGKGEGEQGNKGSKDSDSKEKYHTDSDKYQEGKYKEGFKGNKGEGEESNKTPYDGDSEKYKEGKYKEGFKGNQGKGEGDSKHANTVKGNK